MHDVHYNKFNIRQEDTLENPQHEGEKFEAIVANPPFSAQWSANPLHLNDERFSEYGKLAPKSKADFAFVQHMIHHLDDNGTMAIVLPHGVLFRGAVEGHIRRYLIEDKNYLDAVIGMPSDIFYGTNIPTVLLVFKKYRENLDNILFVDASKHFKKVKKKNVLRTEDISKVLKAYKNREFEDKYAYVATMDEIKENDYNLNITRYVDTFEEEEPIDLKTVSDELKQVDSEIVEIDEKVKAFCEELGLNHQLEMEKLLPEIRFPEFSDEWTIKRLGDLIFEKVKLQILIILYSLTIANGLIPKPKHYEEIFWLKPKRTLIKK